MLTGFKNFLMRGDIVTVAASIAKTNIVKNARFRFSRIIFARLPVERSCVKSISQACVNLSILWRSCRINFR